MILEGKTDLSEAAVMQRAVTFFAGGLRMSVLSETVNAVSLEGDAGTVNVTVSEQGPDTFVQVIAEGVEDDARRFLRGLEGIQG